MSESTLLSIVIGLLALFVCTAAFACLISGTKKFTVIGRYRKECSK